MSVKKIALLGVMTTLALIFSYIESLLPVFAGIPGVKLGLPNLVVVFLLYRFSVKDAVVVSVMRVLLAGFLFGNMMSIIFSLTGTLFSIFAMWLLKSRGWFSIYGVSVCGACMHNIGQIIVSLFVLESVQLLYYVPALLLSGVVTGLLIGVAAKLILLYIPYFDGVENI